MSFAKVVISASVGLQLRICVADLCFLPIGQVGPAHSSASDLR